MSKTRTVLIVRNANLNSNANMLRIIDASLKNGYKPIVVSRLRKKKNNKKITKEKYNYNNMTIDNYIIEIESERAAGIKNMVPLVIYQFMLFYIFLKLRNKIDMIHSFDLDTGLTAMMASKIFRKKNIYHIADFYSDSRSGMPNRLKKMVKNIEFFVIKHSNATIIANEARKEQIKGSQPQRLEVIHNSPMINEKQLIKRSRESSNIKSNNRMINLCYVGGLSNTRFINEILEFASLNNKYNLILAGYGSLEKKVEQYANEYSNIEYLGEIPYKEALSLYAECDIMFAMYDPKVSNHKYSAPNKIYEAMMLRKPIIVAKNSGIDKLVETEKVGLVSEYNLKDFRETMKRLTNNVEFILDIQNNSKQAYPDYSWDKMVKRLNTLYESL